MSRCESADCSAGVSFPRVSGDEPAKNAQRVFDAAFSPRERG